MFVKTAGSNIESFVKDLYTSIFITSSIAFASEALSLKAP